MFRDDFWCVSGSEQARITKCTNQATQTSEFLGVGEGGEGLPGIIIFDGPVNSAPLSVSSLRLLQG